MSSLRLPLSTLFANLPAFIFPPRPVLLYVKLPTMSLTILTKAMIEAASVGSAVSYCCVACSGCCFDVIAAWSASSLSIDLWSLYPSTMLFDCPVVNVSIPNSDVNSPLYWKRSGIVIMFAMFSFIAQKLSSGFPFLTMS